MPIEPPDPLQIARVLEDQLAQLRALISSYPDRPEYSSAADFVSRAIEEIKSAAAVKQALR
jgi:hypothetical protein